MLDPPQRFRLFSFFLTFSSSDLARSHHIPCEALRANLRAFRPGLDILLGAGVDRALRGIRDSANLCILWLGLKYINIIV